MQKVGKLDADGYVRIRPFAVFSKTGKLWFNSGKGISSYVSVCEQPGAIVIDAVRLDDDMDTPVTFIKMDIEGSEKNALTGAVKIMESYSPKLSICIYHSLRYLYELPILIMEKFKSYNNFAIRHHSPAAFTDTVFYAWRS